MPVRPNQSSTQISSDGLTSLATSDNYVYNAATESLTTTVDDPSGLMTSTVTNTNGDTLSVTDRADTIADQIVISKSGYDVAGRPVQQADTYGKLTTDVYADLATGLVTEVITPTQTTATGTQPGREWSTIRRAMKWHLSTR